MIQDQQTAEMLLSSPARPRWCYRVDRLEDGAEDMFSWGSRPSDDLSMERRAYQIGMENRLVHPYYRGLIRVRVWEAREDEHYKSPPPEGCEDYYLGPELPEVIVRPGLDRSGYCIDERCGRSGLHSEHS